ncbi:acyl-CoA synthetase [Conexibacter woesei]|uniref:AMP-dependent synthetase and ligase n=1 Tax=Conexibacter woesei (strain DSM 14684 / CCUG 47730 / CIP 108061 / JCM 11494 / NBRC 100937 / ID131577) TaxID=469383 RepID=D3F5U0_CONWI|nr:AMP-binding protein [Conexibacter woesei]ADB52639.1 AMP-dependent synthetase and ligase [Conexibacter woesei DSM 14684]
MNFSRDVVDAADPARLALVELARDGSRREWRMGEVADRSARLAGTLARHGVGRGDTVMTLIGNRSEWVFAMVACFRLGAVVLPCTEQLRAKDLRLRLDAARPRVVVCDERNAGELSAALAAGVGGAPPGDGGRAAASDGTSGAAGDGPPLVLTIPDDALFAGEPAAAVELAPDDPCLITFTSGTAGEPKGVLHAQRYLTGQHVQATHWLDARPGDLVWCTAASGWSKSARNVFIAPWIRGAAALLHDARFDPHERLELLARERVNVLCMAPTEYRVIAKRADPAPLPGLRGLVAAGEALNPEVLRVWQEATGVGIRDGYGQTETGQLTGAPLGEPLRPGSMGRALPGVSLRIDDGELVADPATVPTFFLGYLGSAADRAAAGGVWRTGDRVRQDDDGFLFFEGRTDDVIISAGYRIGPFEVESALVAHPAVAEAAVVAAPDDERGAIVRAVVVLRDGRVPSDALARELQDHVKHETAPYKYPRRIDFAAELPKTSSGKVRRALLREQG